MNERILRKVNTVLLALVAAVVLALCAAPRAYAAETSGECGDGVRWEVAQSVLTISGRGAMRDYGEHDLAPWNGLDVAVVRVEEGVQSIGDLAFFDMDKITSATVAGSVKTVGDYAFFQCRNLKTLTLGSGVTTIGESAFERCEKLAVLRLPESVKSLGRQAFYCCESLQSVTVPASVNEMGTAVFAHCTALRSAMVLAQITELPVWTFYGCTNLGDVVLGESIVETGVEAFAGSAVTAPPMRPIPGLEGEIRHEETERGEDGSDTTHSYVDSGNSAITTETTGGKTTIDAVLENSSGWDEVQQQIGVNQTQVQVQVKGDAALTNEQLNGFSKQNVTLTIQTEQGAVWHIDGSDLLSGGNEKKYTLNYTLRMLDKSDAAQTELLGGATAFIVVFESDIDFKTEVELPLGTAFARSKAAFFAPADKVYTCHQQVLVDDAGRAHFYLEQVERGTEYIVGINVPNVETAPLIPEALKGDYGVDQESGVDYVITGRKSSWGMDIGQVTWILVGVMGGAVVIVGVTVGVLYRRKIKRGYVPEGFEDTPQ
ncbi:MAG: leucine-rich repeat domain-containing protein [Ruminococcaceae bacterium]|nr:leucine-rich repeat domain-containing protein [Oscillospiraceae bacterium]